MRRREFLGALGGTAMWPLGGARAQQSLPFIAFLSSRSAKDSEPHAAAFLQGLSEAGYVPGQNLRIEYRWADGHYERLQELATELVGLRPAVLVAGGGEPSAVAAKSVTATIPIVFVIGGDPVKSGLTASLNRPNTNATGVSIVTTQLGGKRVHLMSELVPNATTVALLVNPNMAEADSHIQSVQTGADTLHRRLLVLRASTQAELEPTFDLITKEAAGGLMSYGASLLDAYGEVGRTTARILKGERPQDIPVLQPTRFELVINSKTARSLRLVIPPQMLAIANEVVE